MLKRKQAAVRQHSFVSSAASSLSTWPEYHLCPCSLPAITPTSEAGQEFYFNAIRLASWRKPLGYSMNDCTVPSVGLSASGWHCSILLLLMPFTKFDSSSLPFRAQSLQHEAPAAQQYASSVSRICCMRPFMSWQLASASCRVP